MSKEAWGGWVTSNLREWQGDNGTLCPEGNQSAAEPTVGCRRERQLLQAVLRPRRVPGAEAELVRSERKGPDPTGCSRYPFRGQLVPRVRSRGRVTPAGLLLGTSQVSGRWEGFNVTQPLPRSKPCSGLCRPFPGEFSDGPVISSFYSKAPLCPGGGWWCGHPIMAKWSDLLKEKLKQQWKLPRFRGISNSIPDQTLMRKKPFQSSGFSQSVD